MSFRKEEIYGKQKDNKTHGCNLCRDRALSLTGGVLAQSREGAHAEGRKLLYSADFENLNTSATAGEIYGATHFAGANRSIEETSAAYIERRIRFSITAARTGRFILDSGRGVSSSVRIKRIRLQ